MLNETELEAISDLSLKETVTITRSKFYYEITNEGQDYCMMTYDTAGEYKDITNQYLEGLIRAFRIWDDLERN